MSHGSPPGDRVVPEDAPDFEPQTLERGPQDAVRLNEAGLRLALEAGDLGGWEWEIGSGAIRWSRNVERIHGLAPGSFAGTFDALQTIIHPEDRERVIGVLRACIERRGPLEIEYRTLGADGRVHWISARGKVLANPAGQSARMAGICMEITRRKHVEETALASGRRKDEFLTMVSHEMRNPLAVIMNASTLIGHLAGEDPVLSNAGAATRRQTDQLVRIIDDLLDVSRLSAGQISLERKDVDLVALVHRCAQDLIARGILDRYRHELRCAPTHVRGDGPRLEQIVTNLLMNAVRYTPGGGRITVDVEPESGEAVLRVKDTGAGIAPEQLPHVFDAYTQSERRLDRHEGDLGLGLSIARSLVEAHGGRIDVRSAGAGSGTEVVVRLPLAAGFGARDPRGEVSSRQRILIVDDHLDAREALARLLELAGHEVFQAADGPAGLETASRARPDVAIIDIGLPGMNGFEVARRLRAGASKLRLIALSGYGQGDHRQLGDEAGFDSYLLKPVAFETLQRVLANN
jgi:PAS domain S-box-containing protein